MLQIIAACFSVGNHHPDEHYQVLEFCNYKLGHSTAAHMPWEFAAQCRSAILPFIAWCVVKGLAALSIHNPFFAAFLLRLFAGVLAWLVACRLLTMLLPELHTAIARRRFVQCCMLLWYVPYIGVRFSAENMAGILFFLAVSLLYKPSVQQKQLSARNLYFAGLLLGLALFVRFQVGLAYIGLVVWLLVLAKWPLRNWLVLFVGGVCAVAAAICLDRWFYGVWTITPLNYFNIQLVQNRAADWGITAWWDYFWMFFQMAFPPIAMALLAFFFAGIYKRPRHLFAWVTFTFIVGHIFIGHKEMRFLYPVSLAFIYLACAGYDHFLQNSRSKKWHTTAFRALAVFNAILLLVKMLTPAQEAVPYYKFIYKLSMGQPTCLLAKNTSPYNTVNAEMRFYRHPNLQVRVFNNGAEVEEKIRDSKCGQVIYLSEHVETDKQIGGYKLQKIYCLYPEWLLNMNFFEWQDRSHIWTVYRLTKAN